MNYLSVFIIVSLVIAFAIYFWLTRKQLKLLTAQLISFQQAGEEIVKKYNTLNTQYRQLANINKALTDINKIKNPKKK